MNCGVKSTDLQQQPVRFWGGHDICSWTTEMYTGPMFSSCCGGYVLESWRNRYTTNASNNMYLIVFYGEETRARVRSDVGRSHNLSHNQKNVPNRRGVLKVTKITPTTRYVSLLLWWFQDQCWGACIAGTAPYSCAHSSWNCVTMVPYVYLTTRRYEFQSLYYAVILIFLSCKQQSTQFLRFEL